MMIYLDFMHPIAGRRHFKSQCIHVSSDELFRTWHGHAGLETAHVGCHKGRQDALNCHADVLCLESEVSAKFVDERLKTKKHDLHF